MSTAHLRSFKSSKPIIWNDVFINPKILDLKNLKTKKKITTVVEKGKDNER